MWEDKGQIKYLSVFHSILSFKYYCIFPILYSRNAQLSSIFLVSTSSSCIYFFSTHYSPSFCIFSTTETGFLTGYLCINWQFPFLILFELSEAFHTVDKYLILKISSFWIPHCCLFLTSSNPLPSPSYSFFSLIGSAEPSVMVSPLGSVLGCLLNQHIIIEWSLQFSLCYWHSFLNHQLKLLSSSWNPNIQNPTGINYVGVPRTPESPFVPKWIYLPFSITQNLLLPSGFTTWSVRESGILCVISPFPVLFSLWRDH